MEKTSVKKNLTIQEWESLIEDFQQHNNRTDKWLSSLPSLSLLDLSLSALLKKDFPLSLKLNLLIFLDEFATTLFISDDPNQVLSRLVETLKLVIQSPIDGVSITYALKEHVLVSVTSIFMSVIDFSRVRVSETHHLEELVAILLTIINRPNHGVDRQTRAVACECLKELEREFPCLLAEIVGHLWGLCQNERTHACQSYLLLLLEVIHDIVVSKLNVNSVFSTAVPLVPFNIPKWVRVRVRVSGGADDEGGTSSDDYFGVELSSLNIKELKRVIAFLLEWPQVFTPCGMVEFMSMVMPLAVGLELQMSLLKVQFSGLLYNFDPLLWHVALMLYSGFPEAFSGQESEISKRLVLISKEGQQALVFRLLVLHWLFGFFEMVSGKERNIVGGRNFVVKMCSSFYPNVYDALALKSLKLDLLALCSVIDDSAESQGSSDSGMSTVSYFEDGLVCVSAFKWLPPWSSETAVAFRSFHKFLLGSSSHSDTNPSAAKDIMNSSIFSAIQMMLVNLLLDYQKLVPVVVALIDRLLLCQKHCWLGKKLLQTIDEHLLPKVVLDYRLSSYFLLFDRIGKNDSVPPQRLIELLTKFAIFLAEKHGHDTGLKSWSHGSKVLGVCRTMLMQHHSSRLFMGLSRLLAFISLCFPDLEVRDNARIYLRMLICIPGKKLRHILNIGDQFVGVSPSPPASSFLNVQSPWVSKDPKKSISIANYIHLERVIPLLVKQSWSLSLPALGYEVDKYAFMDGIKDGDPLIDEDKSNDNSNIDIIRDTNRVDQPRVPLRVMDSKISKIVDILRMHFSCFPDFRHMPGLKINIPCTLRFRAEPFNRIWGSNLSEHGVDDLSALPAMYAIVLKFSSSAPYGSIPSYHIPFLVGESSSGNSLPNQDSLDIVPVETPPTDKSTSRSPVSIELEPREPVPGLIDVSIDANAENGQIIHGKLHSVSVGIEDMFLKAAVPDDIPEDVIPEYYSDLFNALWEACGACSNTGREMFSLKGGKGFAGIYGTQSVKLLELPANLAIRVIERYLTPFVVSVIGAPLVEMVKDQGFIKDVMWMDVLSDSADENPVTNSDGGPLYLTYCENGDNRVSKVDIGKINMGRFLVLIFLPPRYHLLFRMEVSDVSTLVRIRTDHWPCLAYVDEYLEALFS